MVIYKAANIKTGKIYIGQTQNLTERIKQHNRDSKRYTNYFAKSIKKYGISALIFIQLEICSKKIANEREKYWIAFYDSANPVKGYNQTYGGDKKYFYTKSVREKMRNKKLGTKWSSQRIIERRKTAKNKKSIKCIETGEIFESIKEAGRKLNIRHTSIRNVLSGRRNKIKGLSFERIEHAA